MPPKKTKRTAKKGSKVDVSPEPKSEELVQESSEVATSEANVELKVDNADSGPDLVVESQPSQGEPDPQLATAESETLDLKNQVEVENMNVDLKLDETSGALQQEQPKPPFEDFEAPSDDLLVQMGDLLHSLVELSSELEEQEEDEEEGAIKEDEVPFERLPELNGLSSVLLVVNLPPELDSNKVLNVFKQSNLVSSVTLVSKTQVKLFFTSPRVAAEAKSRLDNMKLYNRKLQALYAREVLVNKPAPPPAFPPMPQQINFHNKLPNNYPIRQNNFPGYNVPPPPTKSYTGAPQDKNKITFNKYKLLNVTLPQLLLEFYNKINQLPSTGKSKWDESKTFFENQVAFDKMYQKLGVTTRYVLIGNLSDKVLENGESVHEFLSRFTINSYTYQVVKLPYNYPNVQATESAEDRKWLHVVFDRNRDGSSFFNKLNNLINYTKDHSNPEREDLESVKGLLLRYSCPQSALESLWISNVAEFCGYFKGEDDVYGFFNSLGVVKNFKLVSDSGCIFVTFQNKDTATRIYNFLNTLSPKRVIKVSSYSNTRYNSNAVDRVDLETQLYPMEKDDDLLNIDFSGRTENSFVLGQKLLNAIKRRSDSQELIDRLLKTNDFSHFSPENPNKRQRTMRPPEFRRREPPRFERRPHRDGYGRDSYGRDYNRDGYPRDNYGRDSYARDHYGREPYSRDSRDAYPRDSYGRDNYREGRDVRDGYGRERDREYNKFRQRYPISKERVDRFGRTIRNYDRMRREEPWKGSKNPPTETSQPFKDEPPEPPRELPGDKRGPSEAFKDPNSMGSSGDMDLGDDMDVLKSELPDRPMDGRPMDGRPMDGRPVDRRPMEDKSVDDRGVDELGRNMIYCKLLKRGKFICRVSCVFVRGDLNCRLPELLDVNQRANPERLKNCLSKSAEFSLWQLGADSRDDSEKYDSLCDYLISKNRVALVQQGPFDVYIVPPSESYIQMLQTPDANFMYAYLLPRAP